MGLVVEAIRKIESRATGGPPTASFPAPRHAPGRRGPPASPVLGPSHHPRDPRPPRAALSGLPPSARPPNPSPSLLACTSAAHTPPQALRHHHNRKIIAPAPSDPSGFCRARARTAGQGCSPAAGASALVITASAIHRQEHADQPGLRAASRAPWQQGTAARTTAICAVTPDQGRSLNVIEF